MSPTATTADRLLEAHVAWVVAELSGDGLDRVVAREVDELLAQASRWTLVEVVDADALTAVAGLLLARVLPSAGTAAAASLVADQLHEGPPTATSPAELVDRDQVGALVDALLPLRPLVGRTLDQLTESPAAGALASRFISRLLVDVLEANRSAASRVPGLGGIVSIGTNAATRAIGVADRQVQSLLGDTAAGRGAAMAVRRLNAVVMATLEDPALRDAALEAYDELADDPVLGLGEDVPRADLQRLASVVADVLGTAASARPTGALVAAAVEAFVEHHGDATVAEVLDTHGIGRAELLASATELLVPAVRAAVDDGTVETLVRDRLGPFYRSAAVAAVLDGHGAVG